METQLNREVTNKDTIIYNDYYKIIFKKRSLIIILGIVLISIIVSLIISLSNPKKFQCILVYSLIKNIQTSELLSILGVIDTQTSDLILGPYNTSATGLKIYPLKNSADKFQVYYEVENKIDMKLINNRIIEYLNNYPFIKNSVEQNLKNLELKAKEIDNVISMTKDVNMSMTDMVKKKDLQITWWFDPVSFYRNLCSLITEREQINVNILDYSKGGVTLLDSKIKTFGTKIIKNTVQAGIISLIISIILVFLIELFDKKILVLEKNKNISNTERKN